MLEPRGLSLRGRAPKNPLCVTIEARAEVVAVALSLVPGPLRAPVAVQAQPALAGSSRDRSSSEP
jgi:hypothetical protein